MNIDELIKIRQIRHSHFSEAEFTSKLLDYLIDASPAVAGEALRAIFAIQPIAAMPKRWSQKEGHNFRDGASTMPLFATRRGHRNDVGALIDSCVQKLMENSATDQQRLLKRLAMLQGLSNRIANKLKEEHLFEIFALFQEKIDQWHAIQFPRQVTICPTLNCQLACEFCISSGHTANRKTEMPLEMLLRLLNWAQKDNINRIGLTGGEPTLYRFFPDLILQLQKGGFNYYLATNGIFPEQTADIILHSKPLCVTMHLTPQVLCSEQLDVYKKNALSLVKAGIYVILRCNFSCASEDPTPYIDTADQIGIKEIRASIPMPNARRFNRYVEIDDLTNYGELLARYVEEGRRKNIETRLAKPFFPCKLPEETARTFIVNGSMGANCPVHENRLSNNLTIYPDGSFSPCLGLSLNSKRKIFEFESSEEAAGLFTHTIQSLMRIPILEDCQECLLLVEGRCIGACLSYRLSSKESL